MRTVTRTIFDAAGWIAQVAFLVVISVFIVSRGAEAQPPSPAKIYRIGFLSSGFPGTARGPLGPFVEGMRALGWLEGRDYLIEARFAEGHPDRLPTLATDLLQSNVDLIAAGGATASLAAKNATASVPIVVVGAGDPVGVGLVSSLSRPGGNVTGVAWDVGQETFTKSLEILRDAFPKLRRIAVLSNPSNPGQASAIGKIKAASALLSEEIQFLEARDPAHLERAFASAAEERSEAILILTDTVFIGQRKRLAELATRYRLPSMMGIGEYVEIGGLISYGPSLPAALHRAAFFVDKILSGTKPADLPVEQPTKFELIINLKTAEALGVDIPESILMRADRIVE